MRRWTGVVAALAAGVLALAGCASASSDPASAAPSAPPPSVGTTVDHALPASLLRLPLVDAAGQPSPLSLFRGKVIVISDMMTLCQESCPLDTTSVVQTARKVERAGLGDDVAFVSITIDPTRDTPAQLRAYRGLYAPAPADWTTLTGPPAAIHTLWRTLGVYIQRVREGTPPARNWRTGAPLTYDLDHSDEVFFLDDTYHERFVLDGIPHLARATEVPAKLRGFMDAQGKQNLEDPPSTAWTVPQAEGVLSWLVGKPI